VAQATDRDFVSQTAGRVLAPHVIGRVTADLNVLEGKMSFVRVPRRMQCSHEEYRNLLRANDPPQVRHEITLGAGQRPAAVEPRRSTRWHRRVQYDLDY